MIKSSIATIATITLGALSMYFLNNFIVGTLLLVLFIYVIIEYKLKRLKESYDERAARSDLMANCNCMLTFKIKIGEILKDPAIDRLFNQLAKANIIEPNLQKDDWIEKMLDNFNKKYGKEKIEEVTFNIKNNLVWKNGAIYFEDRIYHYIFIPYEYKDGKEEESESIFAPKIEIGISIRIFITGGIIKLQVGEFNKKYTPKMLDGHIYQTSDTITSFPLKYFSYKHKIPENYLGGLLHSSRRSMERRDWKEVIKEAEDYKYICRFTGEYDENANFKRINNIISDFDKKKTRWVEKENFDEFPGNDEEYQIAYNNKYLYVVINNITAWKEKMNYSDYVDEYAP